MNDHFAILSIEYTWPDFGSSTYTQTGLFPSDATREQIFHQLHEQIRVAEQLSAAPFKVAYFSVEPNRLASRPGR